MVKHRPKTEPIYSAYPTDLFGELNEHSLRILSYGSVSFLEFRLGCITRVCYNKTNSYPLLWIFLRSHKYLCPMRGT